MTSLNSGLPSRDTWIHGPAVCVRRVTHQRLLSLGAPQIPSTAVPDMGSVGTERSRVSSAIGTWSATACASTTSRSRSGSIGSRDEMERLERPQRSEVEDRAEVDEEGIRSLPREHLFAVPKRSHRG